MSRRARWLNASTGSRRPCSGASSPIASPMGQMRMALRVCALEERSPNRVVTRLRHLVRGQLDADFATLVYLVFDPDSGMVRFANAGHPPPLVVRGTDGATYLEVASVRHWGRSGSPTTISTSRI